MAVARCALPIGRAFQFRHGGQRFFEPVHDALLRIHSNDPLLDDAIASNHEVGWEGVDLKGVEDLVI